ncbi:Aldo-keto reductase family protein [Pseudomonas syringae pv. rhaphiolepidis]|nr:Aldo-keto reductase family protein [Pseudomonas syringae pv. rhaphiolepidis]
MTQTALVVGASGIVGSAITQLLLENDWQVAALSRSPSARPGVIPVAADLQNPESVSAALADLKPTHVFITAWSRQATEAENIRVNAAMVRNVPDAVRPAGSVKHVALVTGLKHYLGPFEAYGKGTLPQTPFRETQARLDIENFYYAQEDEVFAAAEKDGFTWSVHRPHTVTGVAVGNAMNMATTLAVYASICKATGRPFVFPGSRVQWDSLTDMTDVGPSATVGRHDACCGQSGVQHHQWRRIPLELDVGADRRVLRPAASRFSERASPAGNADGR